MAAPSTEPKPEGAPEWMVSYADMITIMMSFFVIMFALASKKDEQAQRETAASFEYRFSPAWRPFAEIGPGLLPHALRLGGGNERRRRGPIFGPPRETDPDGAKTTAPQPMRVRIAGRGERLEVGGELYFEEASDQLQKRQIDKLRAIAEEIAGKPQKVQILGHASKLPLPPGSPFRDHWDLAYARCRATMQQLVALGIDPKRIRIALAGSNEPAYRGDSPELLKKNSRVDVYLLAELVEQAQPEEEPPANQY